MRTSHFWSRFAPSIRRISTPLMALLVLTSVSQAAPGAFVRADVGTQQFSQSDHAGPICCGERDSWTSWGPVARLGIGWRFEAPISLRMDVVGATSIAETGDGPGRLNRIGLSAGIDYHAGSAAVTGVFGLGVSSLFYSGVFEHARLSGTTEASGDLVGVHATAGARFALSDTLALAADARLTGYLITTAALDLTAGVVYAGF